MPRLPVLALLALLSACGPPRAAPASPPPRAAALAPSPPSAPPAPPPVCALAGGLTPIPSPRVDRVASAPSAENARAYVEALAEPSLRGREAGSSENRRVADFIARELASFGLSVPEGHDHCLPFERGGVRDQNVVAHLSREGAPLVIVGAHYDAQGMGGGEVHPGADDNASGVAALLEIARVSALRASGPSLVVVAFGAEERGVLGAKAYVEAPTTDLSGLSLMVNLDMVGRPLLDGSPLRLVVPRADEALGFIVGGPDQERTRASLDRAAERENTPLYGIPEAVMTRMGFSSDSVPFGLLAPTLFLSDGSLDDYHQPTDTADKIDPAQIQRAARLALAVLDELATMPR